VTNAGGSEKVAATPDEQPAPASNGAQELRARRLLAIGSVLTAVGIAISGSYERTAGGIIVVVGWALVVYGIHSFGRAGS
jgi:hypothetical protein